MTAPRPAALARQPAAALWRLVALLLLALCARPGWAQTFPKLTGLVVDAANVLPAAERASLEAKLEALQQQTRHQLVVATIPDLGGYDLADYGYRLGRAWGIGLKGADNGAILFIAPNEPKGHRGPRIEVGYGLEGTITDAVAWQTIHDRMMPLLNEQHDIPAAMAAGTDALIAQLRLPNDQAAAKAAAASKAYDQTHKRGAATGGFPLGLVFLLVLVAAFLALRWFGRGRGQTPYRGSGGGGGGANWPIWLWAASELMNDRHRGGGFFDGGGGSGGGGGPDGSWTGGGFTGGGGGSFGGGGASGDW